MKQYSILAKHSLIYGLGSAITAASAFILIPIHTQILSLQEYGVLELLNRLADALILVMFMGIRQAYIRTYFDQDDVEWQKTVTSSTLLFSLTSSILISILAFPLNYLISSTIKSDILTPNLFVILLVWIPFEMIFNIGLSYLQINMKSLLFVLANTIKFILFISLNVIFLYYLDLNIYGVLYAQLIGTSIIAIIFLIFFIKWGHMKISIPIIKDMLAFGLPYLPATVFMYIINNSDRYFIGIYSSVDALGIYALAFKIGMFGSALLLDPFLKVWSPFVFKNYSDPEGPILIGNVFTTYTIISVFLALGVSATSFLVIPLIAPSDYHSAAKIIPYICLAYVFYGMSCLADIGILISKKTKYKPFIFGIVSLISLSLYYLLVPLYGLYGAAITLIVSFTVLFLITLFISNKFYRIRINIQTIMLVILIGIFSYLISYYGNNTYDNIFTVIAFIFLSIISYIVLIGILFRNIILQNPFVARIMARYSKDINDNETK